MIRKILIILAILVCVFLIIVSKLPDNFIYSRSMSIPAPVDVVFLQVNDFHNWAAWSPWAELDPNAKNSFEGPEAGTGAIFRWSGNDKVGAGVQTITESVNNKKIVIKLEFIKPFKATHTTEFTFQPEGKTTIVTWSMYGQNDFLGKAMGLVMDCEKMIGDQFEQGLMKLISVVEAKPKVLK